MSKGVSSYINTQLANLANRAQDQDVRDLARLMQDLLKLIQQELKKS